MPEELEVIFNSRIRPKILKLFFQNEKVIFSLRDVAKRCQIPQRLAKKELERLRKIKLFQAKIQKRKRFYSLNPKFLFLNEIRAMIFRMSPLYLTDLKTFFRKDKKIKLLVASGVFLQEKKSPVDLIFVEDKIKKSRISRKIKKLEGEIGKEIKWSLLSREEFNYRLKMNDRFLRDVFDHAHKKIIDKLKI